MIAAISILTNAIEYLVKIIADPKDEVSELKSSSILIHKDVYETAKSEILVEYKEYTDKRLAYIHEKLDSLKHEKIKEGEKDDGVNLSSHEEEIPKKDAKPTITQSEKESEASKAINKENPKVTMKTSKSSRSQIMCKSCDFQTK